MITINQKMRSEAERTFPADTAFLPRVYIGGRNRLLTERWSNGDLVVTNSIKVPKKELMPCLNTIEIL
ncbi:hypothetical protein DHD08_05400 [Arenibacter sp. H213]|nr:hypothetical protein [Arenibacter sp. H213]